MIQRSPVGAWQNQEILMLSPVQLVMVTTYRLSDQVRQECQALGLDVWSIPELIYFICLKAPSSVFDAGAGFAFSVGEFTKWFKPFDENRLKI